MYAVQHRSVREFPDVHVLSGGRVSAARAEGVARAVGRVLVHHEVGGGARVRLKTGNCGGGPMVVQVNLRVGDTPCRIQCGTAGLDDLTPALARLDRQIERVGERWRPRPWPDLTRRGLSVDADAMLARRKPVRPERITPEQAAVVMDAMDYDAHLFTDAETGEDAALYRAGPSGLRLIRQRHVFPPGWTHESWGPSAGDAGAPLPLIVNSSPATTLSVDAAVERAREQGVRSLFFTDSATGRGRLLYPRYDGNLALLVPVGD